MVVIVIIGLLAGLVTINVRGYMTKARRETARSEIGRIVDALGSFYAASGRYPTNDEGLEVLVSGPEPLLSGKLTDPWDRPYQYNVQGPQGPYEVICYGADGREGGEGADADISSKDLKQK
jgi:general secretion pathway protein G